MTKVFLGGSRQISRLSAPVRGRLDNVVEKELPVVIGDANGADKAMQAYLFGRGYKHVEVFCSGKICRNNVGGWKVRHVAAGSATRGAQFYSVKDQVMALESDIGLMLWDGKSVGTLANASRLISAGKRVVVYNVADKHFHDIRDGQRWGEFIAACDTSLRQKLVERVRETPESGEPAQSGLFA